MNKKIKILYISHSPYFNGAEKCLLTLVKNINRDLFEPIVVFPGPGPLLDEISSYDIKTYMTPLERWIRYKFDKPVPDTDLKFRTQKIADIIDKESINIVHTNTSVILEGAIAAKLKKIPHVWHIHEFLKGNSELHPSIPLPIIYEIISYLSANIIAVSEFVKKQFENIIDDEKIITIYNGVEENKALNDSNFLRDEIGIGNDELIAITVGILTEAKGYSNLLKAASIVRSKGYNIKFFWIGGTEKKMVRIFKSKVKKLGLKNSVFYIGFRKDVKSILKCADFLICPSTMETLSLAILEAMATGLCVITTDCGGPSECVVDGLTGYIVPVNDPNKMSEKIIEILCDPKLRKRFGENGFKRFTDIFDSKKFAEKFEDLYKRIVANKNCRDVSTKENILIDSFLKLYQTISEEHWKILKQ